MEDLFPKTEFNFPGKKESISFIKLVPGTQFRYNKNYYIVVDRAFVAGSSLDVTYAVRYDNGTISAFPKSWETNIEDIVVRAEMICILIDPLRIEEYNKELNEFTSYLNKKYEYKAN